MKKLAMLLVAVAASTSVAACGSSKKAADTTTPPTSAAATTAAAPTSAADSSAAGGSTLDAATCAKAKTAGTALDAFGTMAQSGGTAPDAVKTVQTTITAVKALEAGTPADIKAAATNIADALTASIASGKFDLGVLASKATVLTTDGQTLATAAASC